MIHAMIEIWQWVLKYDFLILYNFQHKIAYVTHDTVMQDKILLHAVKLANSQISVIYDTGQILISTDSYQLLQTLFCRDRSDLSVVVLNTAAYMLNTILILVFTKQHYFGKVMKWFLKCKHYVKTTAIWCFYGEIEMEKTAFNTFSKFAFITLLSWIQSITLCPHSLDFLHGTYW